MGKVIYLTREQILNSDDIKTEEVFVPEWNNGTVIIKMMSGKERDAFEASVIKMGNDGSVNSQGNVRAKLVALSIIDPDTKNLMFSVADIEALGTKSAAALDRVFSAAQKLSKVSSKDVDELEKNS